MPKSPENRPGTSRFRLPTEPAQGIAKAKGTLLLPIVKALRSAGEAARAHVPTELHHYLSERVVVSNWYPEPDFVALLHALGETVGRENMSWETMGQMSARVDLSTIYKNIVRTASTQSILRSFGDVWKIYHDTGRMEARQLDDGRIELELLESALVSSAFCGTVTGYIQEMLAIAGLTHDGVAMQSCRATGGDRCVWIIRAAPPP